MNAIAFLICVTVAANRPVTQSIEQITDGMARLDEQFDVKKHSYVIEYEKTGRYFGFKEQAEPRRVSSRAVHTRKGQKIALYFRNADDAEGLNKNEEAWFVWDGKICSRKYGSTLDYYSYLNPVILNYFEFFRAIDVDVYRHVDAPYSPDSPTPSSAVYSANQFDAEPRMLRENFKHYRLRPEQELIDGAWCHVLEWPGYDVAWVDPARSYIPLRREYRIRGMLRSVRLNKELKRLANGLWLPGLSETTTYVLPAGPQGKLKPGEVAYDQTLKLISARFDNVPDSAFKLPVGPDEQLLVHDSIRHMTYVRYPTGTDPLDAALKDVEANTAWETSQSYRNRILFIANFCLVNLIGLFYLVRRLIRVEPSVSAV